MGQAINFIVTKVFLPALLLGMVLGGTIFFFVNAHRPISYIVTEKCYGEDCAIIDALKNYTKYQVSKTENIAWQYKNESEASKRLADSYLAMYNNVSALLDEAYPSKMYCYETSKSITLSYPIVIHKETKYQVKDAYLIKEYAPTKCIICKNSTTDYELQCDNSRLYNINNYRDSVPTNCAVCSMYDGDGEDIIYDLDDKRCATGEVIIGSDEEKSISKTIPIDDYPTIVDISKISANMTFRQKIALTESIKNNECYFSPVNVENKENKR